MSALHGDNVVDRSEAMLDLLRAKAIEAGAADERPVDVGGDECLDRRREPLKRRLGRLDCVGEREPEVVHERDRAWPHDDEELRLDDGDGVGQRLAGEIGVDERGDAAGAH